MDLLKKLINENRKRLGIQRWPIEIIVIDDKVGLTKGKRFIYTDYHAYAETTPKDLSRRSFTVYFTHSALERKDLNRIVLHELLHALLWKMIDLLREDSASELKIEKEEHLVIDKLLKALLEYKEKI